MTALPTAPTSPPRPGSSAATAAPPTRSARSTPASSVSVRSRSATTSTALARVTRDEIEAGPALAVALRRAAARRSGRRDPGRVGHRHDAADPRRPARRRARVHRAGVGQGRLGEPHPLVQGPRRVGGHHGRARARLQPDRVRLDRQPRPTRWLRTRRGSGCRRSCSCRPTSSRPRSSQSAIYGGDLGRDRGLLRRRQPAVLAAVREDEFEKTGFVNVNIRPYYAEGSKTLGFEVAEQLGWRLPRQYVAPMASGSMLTKIHKAFKELVAAGLVDAARGQVFGAQSAGCSPIATAFADGRGVGAGQADRHREVAQHRQPRRRPVRARRRALRPAARWPPSTTTRSARGSTARADDRRVRRDRGRRDRRGAEEAGRVGRAGHVGRDGRVQHRRRAEDHRRGQRGRPPTAVIPPTLAGMRDAGLL